MTVVYEWCCFSHISWCLLSDDWRTRNLWRFLRQGWKSWTFINDKLVLGAQNKFKCASTDWSVWFMSTILIFSFLQLFGGTGSLRGCWRAHLVSSAEVLKRAGQELTGSLAWRNSAYNQPCSVRWSSEFIFALRFSQLISDRKWQISAVDHIDSWKILDHVVRRPLGQNLMSSQIYLLDLTPKPLYWFSLCLFAQHTAVTAHKYPFGVTAERFRSSGRTLTSLSLQLSFLVWTTVNTLVSVLVFCSYGSVPTCQRCIRQPEMFSSLFWK